MKGNKGNSNNTKTPKLNTDMIENDDLKNNGQPSPNSMIQFEEYYEYSEEPNVKQGRMGTGMGMNDNDYEDNAKDDDIKDKDDKFDFEREEMENDYELMKTLNDLKEKNKKLESMNKYQKIKIETLEAELDKTLGHLKVKEAEIEDLKSTSGTAKDSSSHKVATYVAQINNLNLQMDKYKAMVSDKKNEYATLLEKYNEVHKAYDQCIVAEKKMKQELISKEKQISKLIDDLDKKNIVITSTTTQQMKDKENERLLQENKKLEKQKNEIYAAFKKSLKLCSILKREKVHLENARLLTFTEDEFRNLLEINKI